MSLNDLYDSVVVDGWHVYSEKPSAVTTPALYLGDPEMTFNATFGSHEVRFTASVILANPADPRTERAMRAAIDPTALPAALKALNISVLTTSPWYSTRIGSGDFLAADIQLSTHI